MRLLLNPKQGPLFVLLPFFVGTLLVIQTRPVHSFAPIITSIRKSSPTSTTVKKNRHVLQASSSSSSAGTTSREVQPTSKNKRKLGPPTSSKQLKKIVKTMLPIVAGVVLFKTSLSPTLTLKTITSARGAFLGAINSFFLSFPYIAAFIVCGFKAALADFVAQRSAISSSKKGVVDDPATSVKTALQTTFEYRRNLAFLFYGGAYQVWVLLSF